MQSDCRVRLEARSGENYILKVYEWWFKTIFTNILLNYYTRILLQNRNYYSEQYAVSNIMKYFLKTFLNFFFFGEL